MGASLHRSLLYVPGSSEKMLRGASKRDADVLILDLEDGVLEEAKDDARARIRWALEALDFGRSEVWVRVNPLATPWAGDDLTMIAQARPAGVVLPKMESTEHVDDIDRELGRVIPLILMIETVRGVDEVRRLAEASPRARGLVFGAADYRSSLRAGRLADELELLYARCRLLHAARALDIEAFDTPWFEYRDTTGLERSATRARELGFDGKTAVHPIQLPVINRVFSPRASEIQRARQILDVLERAKRQGRAVATLEGEMVEMLHLKAARRTLERARAAGLLQEDEGSV